MKTSLDARGLACPLPVVKANEALAGMTGGTLEVHADNAVAVENLKRLAAQRGLDVAVTQPEDAHFIVAMTVGEGAPVAAQAEVTCLPYRRNVVVAVGTDVMGRGSDELGHVLLKGFLYALAHQPELPQTILFYNGGAHLTVLGFAGGPAGHGRARRGDSHLRHLPEPLRSDGAAGRRRRDEHV